MLVAIATNNYTAFNSLLTSNGSVNVSDIDGNGTSGTLENGAHSTDWFVGPDGATFKNLQEANSYYSKLYGANGQAYFNLQSSGNTTRNPLENIKYTDKVKAQMQQGDYHSFPDSVDGMGGDGVITSITGGDDIVRTKIEISGSYMGKNGVFQYIVEPDGITCNHRLFVPK